MSEWIENENKKIIATKYFNDTAFNSFAYEFSKMVHEEEIGEWKEVLKKCSEEVKSKIRTFLKSKMKKIYFMIFEDEMREHKYEHLIIGHESNLNISFEPQYCSPKNNSSLVIEQHSQNNSTIFDDLSAKNAKGSKVSVQNNQNDSFLEDKELNDLL